METVKLHFKTPLHIGTGKDEMDQSGVVYHSDALKSAIYATGLNFYPEWKREAASFFNSFRISSCFPFLGEELFLPRPIGLMKMEFEDDKKRLAQDKTRKKAKKISYLSSELFRLWAERPETPVSVNNNCISESGSLIFHHPENVDTVYKKEVQQRVRVSNEGEEDTRPFYLDRIYFAAGAGLYFIVHFDNEEIRKQVLKTLHFLGELGIGTDRTVGNGLFSFEENEDITNWQLPGNNILGKQMNLGLYLPLEEEIKKIDLNQSAWKLIKRGGYIAGAAKDEFKSLRKNSIYFFSEGSVFKAKESLIGKFEDLRPEYNDENLHSVWRDGQPIFFNL